MKTKTDLFVLSNLTCWKSELADSARLTGELKRRYSGLNCKMTLKRVINLDKKLIEDSSNHLHHGNTNPIGLIPFVPFVDGIKESENGKYYLDSEKIIKGVILEIKYTEKPVISEKKTENHIVPIEVKIIGYMNLESAKKSKDKVTTLF